MTSRSSRGTVDRGRAGRVGATVAVIGRVSRESLVTARHSWCVALLVACGQGSSSVAQTRDGALRDYDTGPGAGRTVQVPASLKEISGLATTSDGRYLGHNDERGIVYELDLEQGRVVKAFSLGDEPLLADFEGITVVGDRVILVTSEGILFSSPEGSDQSSVRYETETTGIGRTCEVEGLAFEPADRTLLIPCKRLHDRSREDSVTIFRWSIDRGALATPSRIVLPRRGLTQGLGGTDFRPSAIERHPVSGTYFLLSANERAVAEITRAGEIVDVRALAKDQHRQPEGITFTPALELVIADEGKTNGQLTVYRRIPSTR